MGTFVRGPVRAGFHMLAGLIQIIYAFDEYDRHASALMAQVL